MYYILEGEVRYASLINSMYIQLSHVQRFRMLNDPLVQHLNKDDLCLRAKLYF
jgi:hypothetical protein